MKRILCLAHKDFAVLVGDKSNLFWVFGFPVVFALFFGLIFANTGGGNGPKDMEIGLVDQDQSELSQEYAERLDAEEALLLTPMTMEEARERIRKGTLPAALIIKDNFSENNGMAFGTDEPIIQVMADPSRQMQSAYLQGLAAKAQFEGFSSMFKDPDRAKQSFQTWREGVVKDPDMNPLLAANFVTMFNAMEMFTEQLKLQGGDNVMSDDFMSIETISVEQEIEKGASPVHGFQVTFPQCILWGIMGCAATFAVSLFKEQPSGTLARLCVGPIRRSHILAGKGLACFATCTMVMIFLSLLAKLLFKVPIDSVTNFILACVCVNICFVGLMMFVCTLGKTEQSVSAAGWALLMIMAMLGGAMVPLVFMPTWMQTLGTVSPVRWGIYTLEGAIWRNFSLAEMVMPCAVLLVIGVAFFAIGAAILSRRND